VVQALVLASWGGGASPFSRCAHWHVQAELMTKELYAGYGH